MMTNTEVPSWAIDDAIERERQDDFLILIRAYGNRTAAEERALITHLNGHWEKHDTSHGMDECPDYQRQKTRAANLFAEIQRRVRGCSPTPGFMETIDG